MQEQKVVIHETEMCERCCQSQQDYVVRTYDSISGASVSTYSILNRSGHCSMLNFYDYMMCSRVIHFCKSARQGKSEIQKYHSCIAGEIVAAFTDAMFNRPDMLQWYNNPATMNKQCSKFMIEE